VIAEAGGEVLEKCWKISLELAEMPPAVDP